MGGGGKGGSKVNLKRDAKCSSGLILSKHARVSGEGGVGRQRRRRKVGSWHMQTRVDGMKKRVWNKLHHYKNYFLMALDLFTYVIKTFFL